MRSVRCALFRFQLSSMSSSAASKCGLNTIVRSSSTLSAADTSMIARTRTLLRIESRETDLPPLVDVDCNLTHKDLRNDAADLVRTATVGCGVQGIVIPGSSLEDSKHSVDLVRKLGGEISSCQFKATVGIHPYMAGKYETTEGKESLRKNLMQDIRTQIASVDGDEDSSDDVSVVVAAIGECGLDYSDGFPSRDTQLRIFEPQVALACEIGLPLFLHERNAFDDMRRILTQYKKDLPQVLVHCFTGTEEQLAFYLSQGFKVSFSGIICKRDRGEPLRKAIHSLREQLRGQYMIETDAPYLGFSGCRFGCASKQKRQYPNVPSALPVVVEKLSECLEVTPKSVAESSTRLAKSFFGMDFK